MIEVVIAFGVVTVIWIVAILTDPRFEDIP